MKLPVRRRLEIAMHHAGPSITITSMTNALAFMSGTASSIPAMADYAWFCAVCILMLYFSVLTIFLPAVYWDTLRVQHRWGDCFGLFFCREDSILFNKGEFLSGP